MRLCIVVTLNPEMVGHSGLSEYLTEVCSGRQDPVMAECSSYLCPGQQGATPPPAGEGDLISSAARKSVSFQKDRVLQSVCL